MSINKNSYEVVEENEFLADKEKYADMFSEGNKILKELLLYAWDNNIYTRASCIGHNEEEKPYITFDYNSVSLKGLSALINSASDNERLYISITKHHNFENFTFNDISMGTNNFFEFILNNLKKQSENINELYLLINNCINKYDYKIGGFQTTITKKDNCWEVGFCIFCDVYIAPEFKENRTEEELESIDFKIKYLEPSLEIYHQTHLDKSTLLKDFVIDNGYVRTETSSNWKKQYSDLKELKEFIIKMDNYLSTINEK